MLLPRADNNPYTLLFQEHGRLCQPEDPRAIIAAPGRSGAAVAELDQASVTRDSGAPVDPQTSGHQRVIEPHGAGPDPPLGRARLITRLQDHHAVVHAQTQPFIIECDQKTT